MKTKTLCLIKPCAVEKKHIGEILSIIEKANFKICTIKKLLLTNELAEKFYAIHKNRSFFEPLIEFMTSGEIVAVALEKEDAVENFRKLIGKKTPELAKQGTIRHLFGETIRRNAVHGSDSDEHAKTEIELLMN